MVENLVHENGKEEKWGSISKYDRYLFSTFGRVWDIKKDRLVTLQYMRGKIYAPLSCGKSISNIPVFRLVARTFLGYIKGVHTIKLVDGNRENANIYNIYLITKKEERWLLENAK